MTKRIKGGEQRKPIYAGATGKLAKVFDSAVAIVAPRLAHRMRVARIQNEAVLAYEAAKVTRTEPAQSSGSADGEILPDLKKLRDISRNTVRDDAHAASAVQTLVENIVGDGIRPQATCTPEKTGLSPEACEEWNRACEAAWERWAENDADATRRGSFYDLQALALRCDIVDGDAIGHAVIGGDGFISCELIDADRLESPGFTDTDTIRGGVELGPHGEPVAFHILRSHPNDWFLGVAFDSKPVRVEAEDKGISLVQHVFSRKRPGQTRGVPLLAASASYTRHLHHYLNSELIAARANSNVALFIKRPADTTDRDIFPVQDDESATGQHFVEELTPGTIEYLNEGEEIAPFTPNRPGSAFEPFVIRILRAIAASMGLCYELVAKDFANMNLSSARAVLRECRRGFDNTRRRLVRSFCTPWWKNVIMMEVRAGRLKAPSPKFLDDPTPFLTARWVAPSYGMVDPVTDVEASIASVGANLSTPYEEAARSGLDAEQVLRERARFLKRAAEIEAEFGLDKGTLTTVPGASSSQPAQRNGDAPTSDDGEKADKKKAAKETAE
jgi:lambda family phage portal protein